MRNTSSKLTEVFLTQWVLAAGSLYKLTVLTAFEQRGYHVLSHQRVQPVTEI